MIDPAAFEANNRAFLQAGLTWLRALLADRVRLRQLPVPVSVVAPRDRGFLGFHFRHDEPGPAQPATVAAAPIVDVSQARASFDAAGQANPPPALMTLAARFGLTDFERDTLLLCAACEIDPKFPHLIAAAQDALASGAPSFGLALDLFEGSSWEALSPERPLRRFHLLELHQSGATSLLTAPLRIDERIAAYVKGLNYIDERLASMGEFVPVPTELPPSHQAVAAQVEAFLKAGQNDVQVELTGWDRSSKRDVAAAAAASAGLSLLTIPSDLLPRDSNTVERFIALWHREILLLPIALLIAPAGIETPAGGDEGPMKQAAGGDFSPRLAGTVILDVTAPTTGTGHVLRVDPPTVKERRALWSAAWLDGKVPDPSSLDHLAGEFAMPASRIHAAIEAEARDGTAPLSPDRLWDWCVARAGTRLEGLAERIEPRATIDEVKLAQRDREQLERLIRHGRSRGFALDAYGFSSIANRGLGLAALFHGESGTGKTMAAEAVANELKLALYRVDLASVMSKYIGDTTKKLRSIFDAADGGGVMLLFDEADAVFGKRSEVKDSHDRYANIDINYLLTRMETFAGMTVLATNMKHALDPAFQRRLRFMIGFAFPGAEEREAIWRGIFPAQTPLEELDYKALARFPLTGGSIFNCALGSAHEAAGEGKKIGMRHILTIIRAEMQKLERPIPEREFALIQSPASGGRP